MKGRGAVKLFLYQNLQQLQEQVNKEQEEEKREDKNTWREGRRMN